MNPAARGYISILTYHSLDNSGSVISVAPKTFAAQMIALAGAGLRGIALRQAVAHRSAYNQWPERSVVLTFDDGYENFLTEALPVLRQHDFSATVFLISAYLGGRNDWAPPPDGLGVQRMLSAGQACEVAASGIEIGAHTRTHLDLATASPEQIDEQLAGSRRDLEGLVGGAVESFAYPYGNVSAAAVRASRRIFSAACTTTLARAGDTDVHVLPRVDAYYLRSTRTLLQAVSGKLDWYLTLRRWARALNRFEGFRRAVD